MSKVCWRLRRHSDTFEKADSGHKECSCTATGGRRVWFADASASPCTARHEIGCTNCGISFHGKLAWRVRRDRFASASLRPAVAVSLGLRKDTWLGSHDVIPDQIVSVYGTVLPSTAMAENFSTDSRRCVSQLTCDVSKRTIGCQTTRDVLALAERQHQHPRYRLSSLFWSDTDHVIEVRRKWTAGNWPAVHAISL